MVSGDKYRTCQSNGSWNGTEPTCAGSVVKRFGEKAVFFIRNNVTVLWKEQLWPRDDTVMSLKFFFLLKDSFTFV